MELPDEDTDLGKSSFRSLSAQERFQLAKQAEQRYRYSPTSRVWWLEP